MRYPNEGVHPRALEFVQDTQEYKEADCIEFDGGYRVDKVLKDDTYRTYRQDGDGVWQRTRKFPFTTKDEAVREVLALRMMNNGG